MTKHFLGACKKLIAYQRERFPVVILAASFLPAILSSGAVTVGHTPLLSVLIALVASLAYLFHIRVIDEHRDFEHDTLHHSSRPVQRGVISKKELRRADVAAVTLLLLLSVYAGFTAFILALGMLAYAYVAEHEFFLGEHIRRRFFLYNGINLIQMFALQLFVYAVFTDPFPFTPLVAAHFLFTALGTVIFEFVRKIKRPEEDGTGKDTYTGRLGLTKALSVFLVLLAGNAVLFFRVVTLVSPHTFALAIFSLVLALAAALPVFLYLVRKEVLADRGMQLSFPLVYGVFNFVIYFLARSV